MKITIENTSKIIEVNGVHYRIWEGFTDTGIPCHTFIRHITADTIEEQQLAHFYNELLQMKRPSPNVKTLPDTMQV